MANSNALESDIEKWGNRFKQKFNRILILRFIRAYAEMNIHNVKIKSEYAIYPESYYKTVNSMDVSKTIDFCFIGGVNANALQKRSREWVHPFVSKYFGDKSYLNFTDEHNNYISKGVFDKTNKIKGFIPRITKDINEVIKIDKEYFKILKQSQFCLCPAGDEAWSMRFYEALMCKSIPIVEYKWETWRSMEESKLDYKYYLTSDPEIIYREDWALHNYNIFIKYHTIPKYMNKCTNINCNFAKHNNILNNNGTHCCMGCKKTNGLKHGKYCEKKINRATY